MTCASFHGPSHEHCSGHAATDKRKKVTPNHRSSNSFSPFPLEVTSPQTAPASAVYGLVKTSAQNEKTMQEPAVTRLLLGSALSELQA